MKATDIKKKPTFSNEAIWNMDSDKFDVDNEREYVITSIMENGDNTDLNELIRYYGIEFIKETLANLNYLPPRAAHLARALFGINRASQSQRSRVPA